MDATRLRIPRRPPWSADTTPEELDEREAAAFLDWRRGIASLEESLAEQAGFGGTMLTPFEKNIHVWRQLWRVVERSDVVVQIVDARNPLLYYCPDLRRYVVDEMHREHVLLVNKADLLTPEMITKWEAYYKDNGLHAYFFSAFAAACLDETHDPRVMGVEALMTTLHSFERTTPVTRPGQRVTIGFTGYPNVGKSSTINVLLETAAAAEAEALELAAAAENASVEERKYSKDADPALPSIPMDSTTVNGSSGSAAKRVGVSSTPGKTKHFQTLVLSERVMLCDCPGLVFPNFSASKSELICAGVLSIDQMRGDAVSPVAVIARRIPAAILEGVYGIRFPSEDPRGLLDETCRVKPGYVSAVTLLSTHARARGFMTDHDRPDMSRSARVLLKHYVAGRILFAHSPPPAAIDEGQPGVGPDIISKKGALVLAREEAGVAARSEAQSVTARLDASDAINTQEGGQHGTGLSNAQNLESKNCSLRVASLDSKSAQEPCARISRGKKHAPKAFTRVERSFYPDPHG